MTASQCMAGQPLQYARVVSTEALPSFPQVSNTGAHTTVHLTQSLTHSCIRSSHSSRRGDCQAFHRTAHHSVFDHIMMLYSQACSIIAARFFFSLPPRSPAVAFKGLYEHGMRELKPNHFAL